VTGLAVLSALGWVRGLAFRLAKALVPELEVALASALDVVLDFLSAGESVRVLVWTWGRVLGLVSGCLLWGLRLVSGLDAVTGVNLVVLSRKWQPMRHSRIGNPAKPR